MSSWAAASDPWEPLISAACKNALCFLDLQTLRRWFFFWQYEHVLPWAGQDLSICIWAWDVDISSTVGTLCWKLVWNMCWLWNFCWHGWLQHIEGFISGRWTGAGLGRTAWGWPWPGTGAACGWAAWTSPQLLCLLWLESCLTSSCSRAFASPHTRPPGKSIRHNQT